MRVARARKLRCAMRRLVSPRPVSKGRAWQRNAGASLPPKPMERGDAKPPAPRARTPPPRSEASAGEVRRLSISDSRVMTFADAAYSGGAEGVIAAVCALCGLAGVAVLVTLVLCCWRDSAAHKKETVVVARRVRAE